MVGVPAAMSQLRRCLWKVDVEIRVLRNHQNPTTMLLGAEIEHQTARDSTEGTPEPMGRRGAHMADTLGESK